MRGRRGFIAALAAFVCVRPGAPVRVRITNRMTGKYLTSEGAWRDLVPNFAFGVSESGAWIRGR